MKTIAMKIFLLTCLLACPIICSGQALPYIHHTEIGVLMGKDAFGQRGNFSVQTLHGVRFDRHQEMGFLIGLDSYPGISIMPIGMGWRGIVYPQNWFSWYGGFDLGYGSTIMEQKEISDWGHHSWFEGGIMYRPSIGFRLRSNGYSTLTFSLGYKHQVAHHFEGVPTADPWRERLDPRDPSQWINLRRDRMVFRNLSIKVGYAWR